VITTTRAKKAVGASLVADTGKLEVSG